VFELGKKDFAAGLNKAGEEGWELVAVLPAHQGGQPEYYFKRPKGQASREESRPEPRRAAAAPQAAEERLVVIRLKSAPAAELFNTIAPLFPGKDGPIITSDARTNALLLRGSQKQIEEVTLLIRELDVPAAEDSGARKKGTP
jgi:type II secretory pathway component GspD/PulD (secretin)